MDEWWKDFLLAWLYVGLSFVFWRLLQFIVRWYLWGKCTFRTFSYFTYTRRRGSERNSDSTTLSNIPPNKKWRICNEVVSLIHAGVSGVWAAYSIGIYRDIITDMITFRHPTIVALIYVSTGYLLHDLLDLLINERSVRIIELLFHHVVVLTAFATTQITQMFLGVVIFGLLMELNSVFLHTRSLLNLFGVAKKSVSFRIVALLNMISLLVFRLAVSVYLCYWLFTFCVWNEPWMRVLPCFFVIVSLMITNTVLAYRVMAADGLFGKKRSRSTHAASGAAEGAAVEGGEGAEEEGENEESASSDEHDDAEDGVPEIKISSPRQSINEQKEHLVAVEATAHA